MKKLIVVAVAICAIVLYMKRNEVSASQVQAPIIVSAQVEMPSEIKKEEGQSSDAPETVRLEIKFSASFAPDVPLTPSPVATKKSIQ